MRDRDDRVIIERERETTTGTGGVIAPIVAVVAIVLIVWSVMVSGDTTDDADIDTEVPVPTTIAP